MVTLLLISDCEIQNCVEISVNGRRCVFCFHSLINYYINVLEYFGMHFGFDVFQLFSWSTFIVIN